MKAQLISYGSHNEGLEESTQRVIQGGGWKRQRIVMIMPAGEKMATKVALSHMTMAFPPNQAVHRILAQGQEVGEAYSNAIQSILDSNIKDWEYILTVESDNIPPPDGVIKLLKRMEEHPEYSCIGGLYWCKGPGGCPHIWGDPADPILNFRPQPPKAGELVECCGTSMGFNLWRMSMFRDERLRKPWFKTLNGENGQGIGTQDLHFWGDARKYGYRCAVDCGVLVGHHDLEGAFGVADFVW